MSLRKDVVQRLLLAKSVLSPVLTAAPGQPNAYLVARRVLNAHDAADLALAAIADHQGVLPSESPAPSMIQCLELINTQADKYPGYFKQLNDARNGLKHAGNLPNTEQWASVAADVLEKLSAICKATLGVALGDLDESELVTNETAKAHLTSAKQAKASQDFKRALEDIGKALFVSLEDAPDVGRIRVGRANAEDALKLTAFGVSANDFLRLQEFLPMVSGPPSFAERSEPTEILWKQSEFGHPGNWREEVVDFCIGAYLNVALSIQNAPSVPHAVPFQTLFQYKITAEENDVEVWEDLVREGAADMSSARPDNII